MECKKQQYPCPDECVSYKFFTNRKCRKPPKNSVKYQSKTLLSKMKVLNSEIQQKPHIKAYFQLRSHLNPLLFNNLKMVVKIFDNSLIGSRDFILRDFEIKQFFNLTDSKLNNYLNIFGFSSNNPEKRPMNIFRLMKIVLLEPEEFIEKYKHSPSYTENIIINTFNRIIKDKSKLNNLLLMPTVKNYILIRDNIYEYDIDLIKNIIETINESIPEDVKSSPENIFKYLDEQLQNYDLCIPMNLEYSREEQVEILENMTPQQIKKYEKYLTDRVLCYLLALVIITDEYELIHNFMETQ